MNDTERRVGALLLVFAALVFVVQPVKVTVTLGPSMEPTFDHGDIIIYSQYVSPESGDIIVFTPEFTNGVVGHRIVAQTSAGFQTQGDNNPVLDPGYVTGNEFRGTVISIVSVPADLPIYSALLPDGYPETVWYDRTNTTP